MENVSQATSPKRRAKFAIGGSAVIVIVAGLIVWAMSQPGSSAFWLTVSEVRDGAAEASTDYRVKGNVVPGSLEREGVATSFAITDGKEELENVTEDALPDAFWTAYENDPLRVEVIAQGNYDGRHFAASDVFAKCPSKFKAKT